MSKKRQRDGSILSFLQPKNTASNTTERKDQTVEEFECPICAQVFNLEQLNEHLDSAVCQNGDGAKAQENKEKAEEFQVQSTSLKQVRMTVKSSEEMRALEISMEQAKLQDKCPIDIVVDALPEDFVNNLTKALYKEGKDDWKTSQWTVFNNTGETHRLTASYQLDSVVVANPDVKDQFPDSFPTQPRAPDLLVRAGELVKEIIATMQRTENRKAAAGWSPSYVLANFYRDGTDYLGFHNDSLTRLGPKPVVVGLTLGATRMFRWHRINEKPQRTFTAHLPHNSIFIMWPPMQEMWKHGVPAQSNDSIIAHPLTGLARISLTFRMERRAYAAFAPECHCGRISSLKYSAKRDKYYYKCFPHGSRSCSFFQWHV